MKFARVGIMSLISEQLQLKKSKEDSQTVNISEMFLRIKITMEFLKI